MIFKIIFEDFKVSQSITRMERIHSGMTAMVVCAKKCSIRMPVLRISFLKNTLPKECPSLRVPFLKNALSTEYPS